MTPAEQLFTQEQIVRFVNDPAARQTMLDEHDIEILVDPDAPGASRDNPHVTIRTVLRPEAVYLIVLMIEDGDEKGILPQTFALPGDLLASFSPDGSLAGGVEAYLTEKVAVQGVSQDESGLLEVYKSPVDPVYRGHGLIHEGMYVTDRQVRKVQ